MVLPTQIGFTGSGWGWGWGWHFAWATILTLKSLIASLRALKSIWDEFSAAVIWDRRSDIARWDSELNWGLIFPIWALAEFGGPMLHEQVLSLGLPILNDGGAEELGLGFL